MHCLLWTSHTRTVSSCEPESSTLPSVDTDRQVTWFLVAEGPRKGSPEADLTQGEETAPSPPRLT